MDKFSSKIEAFKIQQTEANLIHKPSFYRIYHLNEFEKLNQLLLSPGIIVIDYIHDQLKELIKYKSPAIKYTIEEIESEVKKHIGNLSIYEYGVWVHYPWTNRLVHILDEYEFIEVRTSRNQYKITKEERDILAKKKIGVIGLSVGQSVSVTLAMERVCGEIRLADFDILELTNLNRIRTGVHNLGLSKTYSVAREISEIDPYLKVTCFPEGLTETNMDEFFLTNGKLDLLLEESDGFDIKILSRYKARELKIPVVMEASDRCTVDVERFDLEPDRAILHGLVNHLDIDTLKQLKTTEEKIPYMLDVLGIETSSLRLKASMLEIEQSINTWPQLASAVTMGGGIATDVSRRLLLNQFTDSGRYHLDIEELIGNKKKTNGKGINNHLSEQSLTQSEMKTIALKLNVSMKDTYLEPTQTQIQLLLDAATKAPSNGNSQPWLWYYSNGNLYLFHDVSRSNSLLDFNYIASYISFGAATENLILKSHEIKLHPNITVFPIAEEPRIICQIVFSKQQQNTKENEYNYLVTEIENRVTNRTVSERKMIDGNLLLELKKASHSIDGAQLQIIESIEDIEKLAKIVSTTERLLIMDQRGHSDFVNETRWTKEENELKRDGIDLAILDLNAIAKAGFIVSKNWEVVKALKKWGKGSAFEKTSKNAVLNSSAMCLVTMPKHSALNYFNTGRSIQRTWLMATKLNISLQPMPASTFLFTRLLNEKGIGLDDDMKNELILLREEFEKVTQLNSEKSATFLFRICMENQPKIKSLRYLLDQVLKFV